MNHMDSMDMMKMYFHFGFGDKFLFKQLRLDTTFKMWLTCGVLFLLTLLFEAIKYMRSVRCGCHPTNSCNGNGINNHAGDQTGPEVRFAHTCYVGRLRTKGHRLIQTLLHVAQTVIGFVLMLSVMSFNLCIIFAIVVGKYLAGLILINHLVVVRRC